jgi:ribosomal protein L37E
MGMYVMGGVAYVQCKSLKHARFMDEMGMDTHQNILKKYGHNVLKASEETGMECPSFDDGTWDYKRNATHVPRCRKCGQREGFSIHGRCDVCGYQQYPPKKVQKVRNTTTSRSK